MHDLLPPGLAAPLALLLAHLLGDFPLQSGRMVAGKLRGEAGAHARHLGVHLAAALAALAAFTGLPLARAETALALGALLLGHGLLDLGKAAVVRRRPEADGVALFAADQLCHVLVVAGAAAILPEVRLGALLPAEAWGSHRGRLLVEAVVLAAVLFPAGYAIRYLLRPLHAELGPDQAGREGLANAGLLLGWLERAFLLFAFAEGSVAGVGLVVGAKSLARLPEFFRTRAFAEYFLIGTLLSVAFAAVGGLVLRAARAAL